MEIKSPFGGFMEIKLHSAMLLQQLLLSNSAEPSSPYRFRCRSNPTETRPNKSQQQNSELKLVTIPLLGNEDGAGTPFYGSNSNYSIMR